MSIRYRLLLILAAMGAFSVLCFLGMERVQEVEKNSVRARRERELGARLQRALAESSGSLLRYVRNYASRPGMAEFVVSRDSRWAERNLQDRLDTYRVDLVWVVGWDGTVLFSFDRTTTEGKAPAPAVPEVLRASFARSGSCEFFYATKDSVCQVYGLPIRGEARGAWLLAARTWSQAPIDELAHNAQGRVWLTGPRHVRDGVNAEELEYWHPLTNAAGEIVAGIDFHVLDPFAGDEDEELHELLLFVGCASGVVLIAGLLLRYWVWRPLATLQRALKTGDSGALIPMLARGDEFGQLARSALGSMRDREQLAQTVEQQAQLARDLHDGVIQSIFGAGMAVSTARETLATDPLGARRLLTETREDLNRTIGDLRGYIERTAPRLATGGFGEAARQIVRQLRGALDVQVAIDVDEAVADRYATLVRAQLLQFVREALSNALRHGRPSRLSLIWRADAEGSAIEIVDDGLGFDPTDSAHAGRGLGNLSERAIAIGAQLEMNSSPGGGTRMRLKLRPPEQTP